MWFFFSQPYGSGESRAINVYFIYVDVNKDFNYVVAIVEGVNLPCSEVSQDNGSFIPTFKYIH